MDVVVDLCMMYSDEESGHDEGGGGDLINCLQSS